MVDYKVVGGKDGQVMHLLKSALSICFWYSICTMLSLPYQRDLGACCTFGCLCHLILLALKLVWWLVPFLARLLFNVCILSFAMNHKCLGHLTYATCRSYDPLSYGCVMYSSIAK